MKRRLNKRGKIAVTILTILASVIIYVLMGQLGAKATGGIIYQLGLVCGWSWLILGQITVYFMVWE